MFENNISTIAILTLISIISSICALLIFKYSKNRIVHKTIINSSVQLIENSWKALENDNVSVAIEIAFAALEGAIRSLLPEKHKRSDFSNMLQYFTTQEKLPEIYVSRLTDIWSTRNSYINSSIESEPSKKDVEKFINRIADLISAIKFRSWRDAYDPFSVSSDRQIESQLSNIIYQNKLGFRVKRVFDVLYSLTGIVFLAPIYLLIAAFIKLDSAGPIFFVQQRVGMLDSVFTMYKFRTMHVDAEERLSNMEHLNEASGPIFKIKSDPRITRVGKLLRKTSMDELPQLINVLRGDMSMVGPTPLSLRDRELFKNSEWLKARMLIRPGITCLWQIKGRNSLPFDKWIELDIQYIREWSLWLDFVILFKSTFSLMTSAGM